MSLRGSSDWKSKVFHLERQDHANRTEHTLASPRFIKTNVGWILFGPQDVRDDKKKYHFALQKLHVDRDVRVRVGCRYYTLPQAWKHWSKKARTTCWARNKNEGKQALAIIALMILQAQAFGLLPRYSVIPFDSSIVKKRKRS